MGLSESWCVCHRLRLLVETFLSAPSFHRNTEHCPRPSTLEQVTASAVPMKRKLTTPEQVEHLGERLCCYIVCSYFSCPCFCFCVWESARMLLDPSGPPGPVESACVIFFFASDPPSLLSLPPSCPNLSALGSLFQFSLFLILRKYSQCPSEEPLSRSPEFLASPIAQPYTRLLPSPTSADQARVLTGPLYSAPDHCQSDLSLPVPQCLSQELVASFVLNQLELCHSQESLAHHCSPPCFRHGPAALTLLSVSRFNLPHICH